MTATIDVWTDPDLVKLLLEDAQLVVIADALVEGAQQAALTHNRKRIPAPAMLALTVLIVAAALTPAVALSKTLQTLVGLSPAPIPTGPQVRATLTSHIATSAPAGARIHVTWVLRSRNSAKQLVPFESHAIFIRITNPTDTATSTASAHGRHGHYTATVQVPAGGIGHVQIGIVAEHFGPNGTRPAPSLFPLSNAP